MTRGFGLFLIGILLAALAGCGRGFFQLPEREAWRHEAEVQCLKSGAVKENSALVRVSPIEGPGICGADFPLKVAALGDSPLLSFADDPRPPAAIPSVNSQPRWPVAQQPRYVPAPEPYAPPPYYEPAPEAYPPAPTYERSAAPRYQPPPLRQTYGSPPRHGAPTAGVPLSLTPPGISDLIEAEDVAEPSYAPLPPANPRLRATYGPSSYPLDRPISRAPKTTLVPLGPARGAQLAGPVPVEIKPTATLACPIVSALDQWLAGSVQPAARRWFGQPVIEIKQISAYSCRGMNGQPGARISEHAFGNALDIAAFTLADGRQVVVRSAWNGLPEEQGFLRDIQGAACEQFSTVLAPGSNQFHYDHIHVDLMRRASGSTICQPAAVPGELAAARAAQRNGYARRSDPGVTGSVAARKALRPPPEIEDDHQLIEAAPYPTNYRRAADRD